MALILTSETDETSRSYGYSEGSTEQERHRQKPSDTYYFNVEQCKRCPFKEGCYKEGSKSKTYSVTIKSEEHSKQLCSRKQSTLKKNLRNATKLKRRIANLNMGTGMM